MLIIVGFDNIYFFFVYYDSYIEFHFEIILFVINIGWLTGP